MQPNGALIRKLRKQRGLSLAAVADACDCDVATVWRLEHETTDFNVLVLHMATVLGTQPRQLLAARPAVREKAA